MGGMQDKTSMKAELFKLEGWVDELYDSEAEMLSDFIIKINKFNRKELLEIADELLKENIKPATILVKFIRRIS